MNQKDSTSESVSIDALERALRSVNTDPYRPPSLSDLDLGDEVLTEYRKKIDEALERRRDTLTGFYYPYSLDPTVQNADRYLAMPEILDTLDPAFLVPALFRYKTSSWMTVSTLNTISLVNERGDTLTCTHYRNGTTQPFDLPWTIRIGDTQFRTFNIELARVLMPLLPENENRSEAEETIRLLFFAASRLPDTR